MKLIVWNLGFCLPAVASAAVSAALSWPECVERAAARNPELQAARQGWQGAQYQAQGARSGYYPHLAGSLGYTRGGAADADSGAQSGYTAGLTLSQNLFTGLQDRARVDQARANADNAAGSLAAARAQVSYNLKSSFEGLWYAKELQRIAHDIQQRREANLRMVELSFESGRENKGSVLLSKAYLEQAKYESVQARFARQTALAQLAKDLGEEDFSEGDIQGEIPTQTPTAADPDFRALATETPDRAQARAEERAAQAAITIARGGFFPSLNLTGALNNQDDRFFPGNPRWSVGLGLNVPLFDGGKDYYALRSATAAWGASVNKRDNVDRQLLAKLKQAYATYVVSVEKLKADRQFLEAAVTRAEIARSRYNNGLLSFEDWDNIENDLITRQKTYLQSQRDRVLNEAAWEQAQGKGAIP